VFTLGILSAALLFRAEGPVHQISRTLGALASLAEEGADIAVQTLRASGNVTVSAKEWAVDFLSSGKDLSREVWNGVDLRNVSVSSRSGVITADGPEMLVAWLKSPEALRLLGGCSEVWQVAMDGAVSVAAGLPTVIVTQKLLSLASHYAFLQMSISRPSFAKTVMVWEQTEANFTVRWSNPLWEMLEYDAAANQSEIQRILSQYFRELPQPPLSPPAALTIHSSISQAIVWKIKTVSRKIHQFFTFDNFFGYGGAVMQHDDGNFGFGNDNDGEPLGTSVPRSGIFGS